jgi:hypothetical protein
MISVGMAVPEGIPDGIYPKAETTETVPERPQCSNPGDIASRFAFRPASAASPALRNLEI